ncbi:MAG: glycoside hydrolase family 3 C-terminal domain-containing protein [Bacteroidota bacterium]|nr:glycoside hydrolase family 3 C-terminal domain-containing protein [Bacteroidota bacterium]
MTNKIMGYLIKSGACLLGGFFLSVNAQNISTNVPQLGKNTIKEVIAAMTLQEKAYMVIGGGRNAAPSAFADGSMIGQTDFRVPGAAGITNAIPRLGIPSMVLADGPAGVRINPRRKGETRTYFATAFPAGITLASTWNPDVVKKVGEAFGNEVLEYGADIILAPGVNIHRNPLTGRNFEYYSEDPVVSGKIASAIITGLQSNGIGTSIKHFAANNQETNRSTIDAIISERALREIYLKGFRIAIKESEPWTVMSSYNLINGKHTSERKDLLSTILREEWGYQGYVMTDWGGSAFNLLDQMRAGNDVIMPGSTKQIKRIMSLVEHDSLDVKVLDQNIERILRIVLKSPSFNHYQYSNNPDLKAHAQVSRMAATEGMVLLENRKKALPFAKNVKKVALFGNISYALIAGGYGSGDVNKAYTISLARGLKNAGYQLDQEMDAAYGEYAKNYKNWPNELVITNEQINRLANDCDVAVLTIGRNSGETKDRAIDNNYCLKPNEKELLQRLASAFHDKGKKLVVVLNICGVIDTKDWKDIPDAILLAWQPGQEGGDAIADILSGKVNPSGKLATSFSQKYEDVPSAKNFPGLPAANPTEVVYQEGIYVGYRYYDTFKIPPVYEFGYGLSYTNFSIGAIKLNSTIIKDTIEFSTTVKNTGSVDGKEVVQVYISAPAKTIDKPVQELKAFAKTKLLKPGESQKLTFKIPVDDLASFYNDKNAWIAEAGNYILKVATSSRQVKQTASLILKNTVVTEKVHSVLHPPTTIDEYKPGK